MSSTMASGYPGRARAYCSTASPNTSRRSRATSPPRLTAGYISSRSTRKADERRFCLRTNDDVEWFLAATHTFDLLLHEANEPGDGCGRGAPDVRRDQHILESEERVTLG